jgi:hypothetical protein
MTTQTLDKLREREVSLKEEERSLAEQWRVAPDSPEGARRRDSIRDKLEEIGGARRRNSQEILAAQEQRKREGLETLLHSAEYGAALTAALEGLAATLEPWQALYSATKQAQRVGYAAPALPTTVGVLFAEAKDWLTRLSRRGILDTKALPPVLRSLTEAER